MINVKKIRKELNLTQSELAEKLDVNIRTVQKWESGETKMSGTAVLSIQDLIDELKGVNGSTTITQKNKKGNIHIVGGFSEKELELLRKELELCKKEIALKDLEIELLKKGLKG